MISYTFPSHTIVEVTKEDYLDAHSPDELLFVVKGSFGEKWRTDDLAYRSALCYDKLGSS